MQHIRLPARARCRIRHPQTAEREAQALRVATRPKLDQAAMRRAVMDSAGVEPGITGLAAPPGFHPRQQLAQIERAGDVRLVHRRRIALAVHDAHALHLAIDLVAHRPRAARLQPDAHLQRPRAVMHQRLGPGHVRERHGRCRAAVGRRQRGLHCRTRHLQIGHARQHPGPAHLVIRQEPLAAVQPGVETLSIQRRAVLVQQRMARRPGSHARLRGDLPVMPTHERITGQRRDAHAPSRIEALPVELDALGPGLEQARVLALVEPAVERARRVLVSGEHGQRAVMRADIALVAPALGCLAAGKAFEFVDRFVDRAGHEGEPMLERLATGLQGEGDLAERRVAMIAPPQGGEQALRSLSQRRLLAGGQDDRHRLTRIGLVVLARIEVLLHDQVRVRTARPERRDASQSRQLALDARRRRTRTRPPGQLALDPERRGAEVDQRVGVVGMQARRQLAVTHLQQHLGQSGDAGRAFGMADVRLHRADRAGQGPLVRLPRSLGEGLGEPRDLDRIAQCGARAVRLEIGDGRGIDAATRQCLDDQLGLRIRVRHRETIGLAAVIDRARANHAMDPVAVRLGRAQALEQHRAHALARHHPVAALAEAAAPPSRRQHAMPAQFDVVARVQVQVDPARDRQLALVAQQMFAGFVDRRQRGRAHRVDRQARAVQIQEVRHAVRHRAERGMREAQRVVPARTRPVQVEAGLGDADEHADPRTVPARDPVARIAGILDHVPAGFEKQAFLRIDILGVARRQVEEQWIELGKALDEAAPFGVAATLRHRPLDVLAIEAVERPAFGRDLGDAIASLAQVLPVRVQVRRLRVAARQPDDRDALARACFGCKRRRRLARLDGQFVPRPGLGSGRSRRANRAHPAQARRRVMLAQVARQSGERRIFEPQGLRDRLEGLLQLAVQARDQHRIDAVAFERFLAVDARHRQLRHRREQHLQTLHDAFAQWRVHPTPRFSRGKRGNRRGRRQIQAQARRLAAEHHRARPPGRHRLRQQPHPRLRAQPRPSRLPQRPLRLLAQPHAALGPPRPRHRYRRATPQPRFHQARPVARESVLERVRRRVIALPHIAPYAGDRREQHEAVQVQLRARRVQVHRARHLWRQHRVEARRCLAQGVGVVDQARRVQHAVQGALARHDIRQRGMHRRRIRHVQRYVAHAAAACRRSRVQYPDHFVRLGRGRAPPGQHELHALYRVHQTARQQPTQPAHAARDQVHAALAPRRGWRFRLRPGAQRQHLAYTIGPIADLAIAVTARIVVQSLREHGRRDIHRHPDRLARQQRIFSSEALDQGNHAVERGALGLLAEAHELHQQRRARMRGQPLTQQREHLPDLRRVAPSERVTRARRVAVGECDHARRRLLRHAHARGLAFHQHPARRRHIHSRCCRTGQPNRLQHPRRRNRRPARARLRRIACRVGRAERGRPVRLARERISRQHQAHRAPRAILVQRVPVAVGALHPLRGQLAQHGLAFGRAGPTKPPADLRLVDPAGGCLRPPARRRVPEAIQDAQRIGRVARDEGEPLAHRLAPDLQGMGERGEIRVRIRAQPAGKALGDQRQTLAIARRQHDQLSSRVVPRIAVARGEPVRRRLVHHEMGVGAAETKRIDRRAPQAARRYRPITQGRIDAERAALQQEMRVRRDEMNARRQLPMPQREQHLQQPGNTGRRERVADVALDRAERAAGARRGMRAERRRQRLELDRIAELSARAMRLDQADACRIDTEAPVHPGLQRGLGGHARRGDAVGPAVLVHAPAAQHAMHGIPIAQRIVEPLEQYHADALGRHESIRARIEAVAAAGRRQHAGVAGHDVQVRPGQHADTAGQREFAAALGETVAGGRYGDQRRRARGVDRQARPLQVERIGDARGEDRRGGAHQVLRRQRRRRQAAVIVAVHAAREHAAGAAGKTPRIDAGRLHAGPRVLEEEPLLGIHRGGFHRRDAEEQRIEAIGLVEQA